MQSNFFETLASAINGEGKSLDVKVVGLAGGQLKVIVSADIGPIPKNAPEAEQLLYGAIATPLVIRGTGAEIDQAFAQRLSAHRAAIDPAEAALARIREMTDSALKLAAAGKASTGGAGSQSDDDAGEGEVDDDLPEGGTGKDQANVAPVAAAQEPIKSLADNF